MFVRNWQRVLVVIGTLLLCGVCLASTNEKKVIEFGWDMPDTGFVKKNIAQMENTPFDGVVMVIKGKRTDKRNVAWYTWSRNRLSEDEYMHAIDDLKSTPFKRFTDNFILMTTTFPDKAGEVGWFDPEWSNIAYNAGCIAKVAKQGGCKGILFDPEFYYGDGKTIQWTYDGSDKSRNFDDYAKQAKERGKEFIRAINREYPDITIISILGYGLITYYAGIFPDKTPEQLPYALLVPFLDGMCEAATPGTKIIDGFETAYGYVSKKAFGEARETVYGKVANELTSCPQEYKEHVSLALPVYPDHWPFYFYGKKSDCYQSVFTPETFQTAVANAMSVSDKYVWVYTEYTAWWDTGLPDAPANVGQPFIDALNKAKAGHAGKDYIDKINQPGLSDVPSDGWKYSTDPINLDNAIRWFAEEFDDSAWQTGNMSTVKREDGPASLGYSFFRKQFDVAEAPAGFRFYICGTSESEHIWVWVNGTYAGHVDLKDLNALNANYALEITDLVRTKSSNTIAIRTKNTEGPGGITRVRISNVHAVKDGKVVSDWR